MRDLFPHYFRPTEDEFQKHFQECTFVLDTNVLLHLYRYTEESSNKLLNVLETLQERLWLPYQVAKEFARRRTEVILEPATACNSVVAKLKEAFAEARRTNNRSRLFKASEFIESIDKKLKEMEEDVAKLQQTHQNLLSDDHILPQVLALFDNRIGPSYPPDELKAKQAEAQKRYDANIPPGFKDWKTKKDTPDGPYGDAILWFQMLDHARKEKKSVVLVTDDAKDDWVLKVKGHTIGPLPALRLEMKESDAWFYLYSTEQFLKHVETQLGVKVDQQVIEEVKEATKEIIGVFGIGFPHKTPLFSGGGRPVSRAERTRRYAEASEGERRLDTVKLDAFGQSEYIRNMLDEMVEIILTLDQSTHFKSQQHYDHVLRSLDSMEGELRRWWVRVKEAQSISEVEKQIEKLDNMVREALALRGEIDRLLS